MIQAPVKFGLLGAGGIAHAWAEAFAEVEEARLAGVYDLDGDKAQALAQQADCRAYPSPEAFLEALDLQAVIVATPNHLHHDHTLAAAAAGKHVLTEKPMALSVSDCDEMITACQEAGVLLMVGQVLRFFPPFAGVLEMARRGDLGRLLGANMIRLGTSPLGQGRPQSWRDDENLTGGLLFEINAHEVDFLLALLGPALSLSAHQSNLLQPESSVDHDLLNVVTTHPGGRQGHLLSGSVACGSVLDYLVLGEEMTLRWQNWEPRLQVNRRGAEGTEVLELPPRPAPFAAELAGMCAAVRGESPVPVSGEEGRAVIATLENIRAAWQQTRLEEQ